MENCPYCGKAFKRLKTHLPHCKAAGAKGDPKVTERENTRPKTGTKRISHEDAKEQHLQYGGGDNVERSRKPQVNKKKQKHLEPSSLRTQKVRAEENEKKNVKKSPKNRPVDHDWTDPGSHVTNAPTNIMLAPELDRLSPGLDRPVPGLDGSVLGLDKPATELDGPILEMDKSSPGLDGPVLGLERPSPACDIPPPGLDRLAPRLDRLASGLDRLAPELGRTIPGLDQVAPGLDQPDLELDRTGPGSDSPAPGSDGPAPGFHIHLSTSDIDHAHSTSHLIDKEESKSRYCPIDSPTSRCTMLSQKGATSLVQMGPTHVAVAQSQTSALQALSRGSEPMKASEDNLTWSSQKEDFRGVVENTGSDGIMSPLYENISKITEDGLQGEDHGSFRGDLQGPFIEKHLQEPEERPFEPSPEPSSSFLLSSMTFSANRLHSQLPRHSERAPFLPVSSGIGDSDILLSQLELTPVFKTETFLPVGDWSSKKCSLGLQWIPELQSNYIQLKIVPGKLDLTGSIEGMGKFFTSGPADFECHEPIHRQLVPEIPLTSRRLMDVRIGELPSWIELQRLSIKSIPELGLRVWTRYYNKYINVRKGGIGGLSMLLVGYCALSYTWNYQHIRHDRWRKYH